MALQSFTVRAGYDSIRTAGDIAMYHSSYIYNTPVVLAYTQYNTIIQVLSLLLFLRRLSVKVKEGEYVYERLIPMLREKEHE